MKKRGLTEQYTEKSSETSSSEVKQDQDLQELKLLISRLKRKYNLTSTDILNLTKEEILIPASVFTKRLSPLETVAKYLRENIELDYSKIAELLGRNKKTIWQAYKNAAEKQPEPFKPKETEYNIPVYVLKTELSILEAVVAYLKDHFKLTYHQIGELLQRNERTVWTVYSRAQKKHEK